MSTDTHEPPKNPAGPGVGAWAALFAGIAVTGASVAVFLVAVSEVRDLSSASGSTSRTVIYAVGSVGIVGMVSMALLAGGLFKAFAEAQRAARGRQRAWEIVALARDTAPEGDWKGHYHLIGVITAAATPNAKFEPLKADEPEKGAAAAGQQKVSET